MCTVGVTQQSILIGREETVKFPTVLLFWLDVSVAGLSLKTISSEVQIASRTFLSSSAERDTKGEDAEG